MNIVDLRPDRNLIDNDFTGYKLSLDVVPVYDKSLQTEVDTVQPGDDQYSYAHVRIFSLHNHLHVNPYLSGLAFFIDSQWNIMQVEISSMNRVQKILKVAQIPKSRERKSGDLPVTVQFASADRALIVDGAGTFHVAAVKKDKWVIVFSDTTIPEGSQLLSAKQEGPLLYILARTILEQKFDTLLQFLVLDENWKVENEKKIKVFGNVSYAAIESSKSLLVINDGKKPPVFLADPSAPVEPEPDAKYKWSQLPEEVAILIETNGIPEENIKVENGDQKLLVTFNDDIFLTGTFAHSVGLVKYSVTKNQLTIVATKAEVGVVWTEALQGETDAVQFQVASSDDDEDAPYNNEELEEVDDARPSALLRFQLEEDNVSHSINLSTLPYLFSVTLKPEDPPAVCVRHLTDGCVWQFQSDQGEWQQTHKGTFPAFGYVQASKTQRKFIVAPENLSYVTISDAFRHLYVFRQPSPVNGLLRNRLSGNRVNAVAKQQLINLETNDEILGIHATNTLLYILTKSKFLVLVINEGS